MKRRSLVVVAVTALVLGISAGVAYAYFTSTGSGTGTASNGTLQTVTVQALAGGDSPTSTLLPGGAATDVVLRVDNPNSYAVSLVSISQNGTISGSGGTGSCTTTGVSFTAPSNPDITVTPGSQLVDLPGAASMSTSSSDGCQGATFHIPVTITVQQG
jgi:hypothetical protein